MAELIVSERNGSLVVDSRLIAERLNIQHEALMRTINKYLTQIQAFGYLRFENGTSLPNANGAVHQTKFAFLNESQATFVMTLSRNTEQVVQCKIDLVVAFEKAKQAIQQQIEQPRQLPPVRDTIDYINARQYIREEPDPIIRSLLNQRLMEDLGQKSLPASNTPTHCILTVRASDLGYPQARIGSGSQLGKFVGKMIKSVGKTQHGRYSVNVYELTPELDECIHAYFR